MTSAPKDTQTSLEKALDVCEALAVAQRGFSVTELARAVRQPAPTVHRLLAILKRRGFVRQDDARPQLPAARPL
jgi:DNA-binding IclR family transcriptional regulator